MPTTSLMIDRYLIASAVVLTCVLFTAQAADPVNVIKLTALLVVAIGLLSTAGYRAIRHRIVTVPLGAAGASAVLLLAALALAALTAPMGTTAVLGAYGRNSGLLAYAAAIVLFMFGLRLFDRPHTRVLLGGVVAAALFTSSYGLLQRVGIDAIAWNNPFNPIIAALGNPNFASGYLGVGASVAVGGALWAGWGFGWRIACGVTGALCLLTAFMSASVQGPIAAAGGLFVVALALGLNLRSRLRSLVLTGLGLAALGGLSALLLGAIAKRGPAASLFSDIGSEARTYYWGGALQMFRDRPLLGVGLDHYGAFWRTARSPESVAALGGSQYSDAAHSVPLQMLAQGGLVLGLAYAAFALAALVALIQGFVRLRGTDRILLGAVGGGWAAYQVQSAVSIDQVPLIALHFTLASAVFAAADRVTLRELRLPGAVQVVAAQPTDTRAKRRVAAAAPRTRAVTSADLFMLSVVATVAAVAIWQALNPLRANVAVNEGIRLRAAGDGTGAFQAYERATDLAPGQSSYWGAKGRLFQQATPPQTAQALAAYLEAAQRDPYDVTVILAAAALAESEGDLNLGRRLYRQAVEADPLGPETIVAAATFELRHSGAEAARVLLEQTVEAVPGSAELWATLGDARAVLADEAAAREAYERALALEPGQATATEGLAKLALAG